MELKPRAVGGGIRKSADRMKTVKYRQIILEVAVFKKNGKSVVCAYCYKQESLCTARPRFDFVDVWKNMYASLRETYQRVRYFYEGRNLELVHLSNPLRNR